MPVRVRRRYVCACMQKCESLASPDKFVEVLMGAPGVHANGWKVQAEGVTMLESVLVRCMYACLQD